MRALFLLTLFAWSAAHAETMYIQSAKSPLRDAANAGAKVLVEVNRGEAVEVLSKNGLWFEATVGGKKGWLSRLTLAAFKPVGKADLQAEIAQGSLEKASRARPKGSADTVASTRAVLASGERKRGSQEKYPADFEAIGRMEKLKVPKADLDKFVSSGSLSP